MGTSHLVHCRNKRTQVPDIARTCNRLAVTKHTVRSATIGCACSVARRRKCQAAARTNRDRARRKENKETLKQGFRKYNAGRILSSQSLRVGRPFSTKRVERNMFIRLPDLYQIARCAFVLGVAAVAVAV